MMNIVLLSMLVDLLKSTDYIKTKYPNLENFNKIRISEIEQTDEIPEDGYYITISNNDNNENIFITKDMLLEYQLRKTKKEIKEV